MQNNSRFITDQALDHFEQRNRDHGVRRPTHEEAALPYELLCAGDARAIAEAEKLFLSPQGRLSDDPLRDMKYRFAASAALAASCAMSGGMNNELALNARDLFVQRADRCTRAEEVAELHADLFAYYTGYMAEWNAQTRISRPVLQCFDYVGAHLDRKMTVAELAAHVHLSPGHLAARFRCETGRTIGEYIADRRVTAACGLLRHSALSYAQIGASLGFSSQSYFTKVFRRAVGMTPRAYRERCISRGGPVQN